MNMNAKIRFVVQDENLLGYIIPQLPNEVQILATSIIKGSIYSWMDGSAPSYPSRQRPATLHDFQTFRISADEYVKDTERYEPIAS